MHHMLAVRTWQIAVDICTPRSCILLAVGSLTGSENKDKAAFASPVNELLAACEQALC